MKQKPGILEAVALVAKIQAFSIAISRTEDGQEARWRLLQDWLTDNPQHRQLVDRCLKQSPAEALKTILSEMQIEPILIQAIDRNGSATLMVTETIETIQQLYRERAGIAQGELND